MIKQLNKEYNASADIYGKRGCLFSGNHSCFTQKIKKNEQNLLKQELMKGS